MADFLSLFLYLLVLVQSALSVVVPTSVDVIPTASDIFTLNNDGAGSCSDKLTAVNTYLSECVELINAALTAYHSYESSAAYRQIFTLYMSIGFNSDGSVSDASSSKWAILETRLANVAQFLSGGGIASAKTSTKPMLFCDDNYAEKKSWSTVARDGNGNEMTYIEDGYEEEYTIMEVYPNLNDVRVAGVVSDGQSQNVLPFWVSLLNGYVFAGLDDDLESLCDKPTRQALTSRADVNAGSEAGSPSGFTYATFDRHVLLCPRSFSPAGEFHTIDSLDTVVSAARYPTENARQFPLTTISATLFHELFHLVDTAGTDSDNGLQTFMTIVQASASETTTKVVNAPEPYVYLATDAYVYQNPPPGSSGLYLTLEGWKA